MKINRRQTLGGGLATGLMAAMPMGGAHAQTRAETLRQVTGGTINTLDPTMPGATRESFGLSMNVYDRLVAFGRKQVNGLWVFDHDNIRGELAEKIERSPDGLKFTLTLRRDAKWHDGTPVTAEDVKWSLDRHVSSKSLAAPQFQTGSLTSPDQFRIAGPGVIEVHLAKPDRLALSNLAVPYAIMINSTLAKKNATPDDPWAQKWLQNNSAGSGAYIVETFRPGEQVALRRNENWKGGPDGKLPFFRRIIAQTVPEAATRANLIERGDADLSIDLQASDISSLESRGRAKVQSFPQTNGFTHISFNTQLAPFDNVKVRQALAAALPYDAMFKAALFERGKPLFNGSWTGTPPTAEFPIAMPVRTDIEKAKALLAEAGHPNGFSTTFTFSLGQAAIAEPVAALVQEALGKIGVKVEIQKVTDAQLNTLQSEHKLAFYTDAGTAWLPATYYFFYLYFTRDQRWNFASWNNPRIAELADKARFETDSAAYEAECKEMISIMADQMPLVMLYQPNMDAVMGKAIEGFTYQFYRQIDFRDLSRA
ncbi:ABC transporter substrate-binding protein [Pararoseomonas indoligenes]|uniref:ABC transporter substrate-binding protein n=1 Tax=Roseomonas indoligenes TaxID=2820811 RepID=A0A940MZE1_9PROT|nr:ABC transporter substrate-binding protein [Pararoseomonas indoligenes]MBP0493674.1 ABC transporter substrate-binding protein [Pararoseomonas indoligenes]